MSIPSIGDPSLKKNATPHRCVLRSVAREISGASVILLVSMWFIFATRHCADPLRLEPERHRVGGCDPHAQGKAIAVGLLGITAVVTTGSARERSMA
jgi:hypothetical protein